LIFLLEVGNCWFFCFEACKRWFLFVCFFIQLWSLKVLAFEYSNVDFLLKTCKGWLCFVHFYILNFWFEALQTLFFWFEIRKHQFVEVLQTLFFWFEIRKHQFVESL
jgi:hypothetical protein